MRFFIRPCVLLVTLYTITLSAQGAVLKDNILIGKLPYFENCGKAIAPSKVVPGGRIVISTGQPRHLAKLLSRPIFDAKGNIDYSTPTTEAEYPVGPNKAIATDNQLIRLKNGVLLAFKDSYTWDDFGANPPEWKDEIVSGSGDHKGQRAAETVFRSADGGKSWELYSVVDFATMFEGKFGKPRPMNDKGADVGLEAQGRRPDGTRKWWVGGPDRTEVYACPFTGNVYLTTRVISGPIKEGDQQYNTMLLLYSKDGGKTWELIRDDLIAWSPLVMTSTPNGRLFLMQECGSQPTVLFSINTNLKKQKPIISKPYAVYYDEDGKPVQAFAPGVKNPFSTAARPIQAQGPATIDYFIQCAHPTISRLSTDTKTSVIRVAYQAQNVDGMQEARVIRVEVKDPKQAPVVTPITTVHAEDQANYSIVYAAFIDPDYMDMPRRAKSNTSVLYWIEAPRPGMNPRTYAMRYLVMDGERSVSHPAYLSVEKGQPRTRAKRQDLGDYMTGGFFWYNNTLNYLCQWVEPDGIKANIVTIPYRKSTR